MSYGREMFQLLWPPAWEAQANSEGWTLHGGGMPGDRYFVEIDYWPVSADRPRVTYSGLIIWLLVNAYWGASQMHLTAWEFEVAANCDLYRMGYIPGDPGPPTLRGTTEL